MTMLEIALKEYGVQEHAVGHNPTILNYAKEAGIDHITNDEISWCSIFMNYCAHKAGLPKSGSPVAKSWAAIGRQVMEPELGDLAILWRVDPKGWQGHVGLFINYSEDKNSIYLLGGNQGNRVCIQYFPSSQVLQFRRLT